MTGVEQSVDESFCFGTGVRGSAVGPVEVNALCRTTNRLASIHPAICQSVTAHGSSIMEDTGPTSTLGKA